MKKLMCAVAAIVAGLAFAETTSGIASANIVGYMGKDLRNGNKMICPMFLNVGQDAKIAITDIKVTGYDPYDSGEGEGGTDGEVYIKILDKNGAIDKYTDGEFAGVKKWYFYYDNEDTEEIGAGWYLDDKAEEEYKMGSDLTFTVGDGLWIYGVNTYGVQVAGQVGKSEVVVPLRNGNTPTGNPYAVARNINQFSVTGYDPYNPEEGEGGTDGEVYIKILDKNGAIDKYTDGDFAGVKKWYFYYDNEDTEETGAGWYLDDKAEEEYKMGNDLTFEAGDGLWVYGVTGYDLIIQAPTL